MDHEQRRHEKTLRFACFGEFRNEHEPYDAEALSAIAHDIRITEFVKAKEILQKEGLDITASAKLGDEHGFLAKNLSHGFRESVGDVLVTGVCFPEKPTVQSVFPLLAIKDLLNHKPDAMAYVAVPVFAYAGAGIARQEQYLKTLGIMREQFGDDLGERVLLIPDTNPDVMQMKYMISNIASCAVSDKPAQEKYAFDNLFRFFETATYGADITIGALAQNRDVSIVSDFRQFESIHAGIRMAKRFNKKVGAALYTLINPQMVDGKLREVSQDEESVISEVKPSIPETNALFYQAALLQTPEETKILYARMRKGEKTNDIAELVRERKRSLLSAPPVTDTYARMIEDLSVAALQPVKDVLQQELSVALRVDRRDRREGVVYEYK